SSGAITGTIDLGATAGSPYTVTVSTDDGTLSANQTFTWTVNTANHAPLVTSPGDQSAVAGTDVSLPISASDAYNDSVSYSASGLPAGLGIDAATGVISGTLATTADAASPYTTTVTISDGSHSSSQSFSWAVQHLALASPGPQTNREGAAVTLQLTG